VEQFADYEQYDAIVWWVRFRRLREFPSFKWSAYRGIRVVYDWDVFQNYWSIGGPVDYRGTFPEVFKRFTFHIVACTGCETAERLRAEGVPAMWIPKAFDPADFPDLALPRSGISHFGRLYPARRAMLSSVCDQGFEVTHLTTPYEGLNGALNRFEANIVCNMSSNASAGWRKWAAGVLPCFHIRVWPGPEALIKNFEVAASGCTLVCDDVPDLPHLGFRDGVNVLTYRTFDELHDKLAAGLESPGLFTEIGARGRRLCLARHTWDHRFEQLSSAIGTLQREGVDAVPRAESGASIMDDRRHSGPP
jgi:hypothetical protein